MVPLPLVSVLRLLSNFSVIKWFCRKDLKWWTVIVCELFFTDHVGDLDPFDRGLSGMECFEVKIGLEMRFIKRWSCSRILLRHLICRILIISLVPVNFRIALTACRPARLASLIINNDLPGIAVGGDRFLKEPARRSQIQALGKHEIKLLTFAVSRSAQISPFAPNLNVGLINTPLIDSAPLLHLSLFCDLMRVANTSSVSMSHDRLWYRVRPKFLEGHDRKPNSEYKSTRYKNDTFGKLCPIEIDRYPLPPYPIIHNDRDIVQQWWKICGITIYNLH